MDFVHSEEVPATSYETHGLAGGVPLRIHKDPYKDIQGAVRAQKDWSEKVQSVVDYKGGLSDPYSFIHVTVPECILKRLDIISYANESVFLYDGTSRSPIVVPIECVDIKADEMEKLHVKTVNLRFTALD